jgi:GTPase
MFIDTVKLHLKSGKGGNGVVTWRREKCLRKGGPTGGNGGKGGSVIIQADTQILALDYYRNRTVVKAESGRCGGPNRRQGRGGKDLVLKVPCGTIIKDKETGVILFDFIEDGQKWTACLGGKGGRGNASFATATNRAPNYCTEGKAGEELNVELELKLIADVGLVGFPNAGKSTLISSMSDVKVKMAAYPFTTLRPNLGYLYAKGGEPILMADIPGIIKGAHQNKGLGYEFLRHIERTKVLLYVLDASGIDGRTPYDDFCVLREELELYNTETLEKPSLVVLNKIDTDESEELLKEFYAKTSLDSESILEVSALQKRGTDDLIGHLTTMIHKQKKAEEVELEIVETM